MTMNHFLLIALIGALAGLISSVVTRRRSKGFNLVVHLLVGVIGAFHGRVLFALIGLAATSMSGNLIFAGLGALLFLYPLKFIRPS